MIHTKTTEEVWIHSMGKRFLIRAIADTTEEANAFMEKHPDTALIASFGALHFIANVHAGVPNHIVRGTTE